jgi:copper transport protein
VGALLVTGIVQTLVEVDAWSELPGTPYGRAVLIKIGLLVVLIGLGALNRQRTLPRIERLAQAGRPPGAPGLVLRRTLRGEVALIAVVLAVTGALSGFAPAKQQYSGPQSVTTALGPAQLQLVVDPARVGANEVHLYLLDPRTGAQFTKTRSLTLTATLPSKEIGPLPLTVHKAGPGHYIADQAVLGARGTWTLAVTDRVSAFDEYDTTVRIRVR